MLAERLIGAQTRMVAGHSAVYTRPVPLLETVPNVSEGRDRRLVQKLGQCLSASPGVRLLDVSSDPDHNRSVLTAVGRGDDLEGAMLRLYEAALEAIDFTRHTGVHPRLGVVDVAPFVPLQAGGMDAAVAAARSLARRVGEDLELPVFLYGQADSSGTRRYPAALRRLGVAGLKEAVEAGRLVPDFGPARVDPRHGVTLIGARHFLVAFNVVLATSDPEVARQIARTTRERDGGLPGVQALGLYLESRGRAQVSINLVDPYRTSLFAVVDHIRRQAEKLETEIIESEIVGLVPEAVVLKAAAEALRLPALAPDRLLESRLRDLPPAAVPPGAEADPQSSPKT